MAEEEPEEVDIAEALAETMEKENGDSHTEYDPNVFHPSGLAPCTRQAFIRKLGIDHHDTQTLGVFKIGTLVHEYIENEVCEQLPDSFQHETQVKYETENGIKITGHADGYDPENEVVYDFKTTGKNGWGGDDRYPNDFDGHKKDYINQLHVYMKALGAKKAKIVYVHKLDMQVRTYPEKEGEFIEFDEKRWEYIKQKAEKVREAVKKVVTEKEDGYELQLQELADGLPFEKCSRDDCYQCKRYETLVEELQG